MIYMVILKKHRNPDVWICYGM